MPDHDRAATPSSPRALSWPAIVLAALMLHAVGAMAGAQTPVLHGIVRDSASREPIAGVVLTVLDPSGGVAGNTIAGADGRFRVPRPAAAARLRARRIGFRPREILLPDRALGDTAAIEIAMDRLPQILTGVRVTESAHCPGSPEAGAAAQLWAQARDGLLASVVARDAMPAVAEMLTFNRTQGVRGEGVTSHRHRVTTGRTTRAFQAAASATVFAEKGYVREDRDGREFNAPDADVLLHDSFAATHCFRLVNGTGAMADQVGLAFEPAIRRPRVSDVEGVLWLDRVKPALRLLEFRYTNLDQLSMATRPGGMIMFATMDNGIVLVTRWFLRMPVFSAQRRAISPLGIPGSSRPDAAGVSLAEIRETGGMVVSARWPDGTTWTQPIPSIEGTVVERRTQQPIAHALVTFAGAWDTVTTDTAGRFAMPIVLGGRFDMAALDTSFGGHVQARVLRLAVDAGGDGLSGLVFELPSKDESVARLCARGRTPAGSSVLLGRIRRADGVTPGNMEIRASWQVVVGAGTGMRVVEAEQTAQPDAGGQFHLCGVALDQPIRIMVLRAGGVIADTTVVGRRSSAGQVDIVIPRLDRVSPPHPVPPGR